MDKNKSETFLLSLNDFGQQICTSQSEPNKKYILDAEGIMTEYHPETSISAIKLELSNTGIVPEESSTDTTGSESNEAGSLEDHPQLGIINTLDGVVDFEENLMNELDSDFMRIVPDSQSQYIMQHMDIREPLTKLRKLLEHRLSMNMQNFGFVLQGTQVLEDHKNLVEQCVQGEGLVQVNVEIQTNLERINIVDVLKPAEDYVHMEDADLEESQDVEEENASKKSEEVPKNIVQWIVDYNYKKEQERLKIPTDPVEWNEVHVRHWVQWAVRQFNLPNIKLSDWSMTGKDLHNLTIQDFQKIVPNDPANVFWTHLELLRNMKVVATKKEDVPQQVAPKVVKPQRVFFRKELKSINYSTEVRYFDPATYSSSSNRTGNNGQIQLWQFLLELLTTQEYKNIIQWIGKEGEFKLSKPELVAQLWGERKNKPTMNYEKLSRALRYYYDGDLLSKVHGKRFVYKFGCNLKQILGYSAVELANLVKYGNPMGET